jgi:hypothetical protein
MLIETELDFIRQNYQNLGATDCAKHLHRSLTAIRKNAQSMGLNLTHENRSNIMKRKLDKPFDKRNVNPCPFITVDQMKPIHAYLLGFIWADGHVSFKYKACSIEARFVTDDALDILPLFRQTGKWGEYTQTPQGCREATIVKTNNRPFAEFLDKMDYVTKSSAPATKILKFIPSELHRYWWLGCIDGDGCFHIPKKPGQEISISSTLDQNWEHLEQLAPQIGVDYHLARRIEKTGTSSEIRIVKKASCSKLIHYLYPQSYEFGLKRKYQKAMQMLERCETYHRPGPKGPWKYKTNVS